MRMDEAGRYLNDFDLAGLFIEELGWDNHPSNLPLTVEADGARYELDHVAQKVGLVAYRCAPGPDGEIPDYPTRRKIERQVAHASREHLIVYADAAETMQQWQWVKREPGRPDACREHPFYAGRSSRALLLRLDAISVALEDEEDLNIVEMSGRLRAAFDVERVTQRFYIRFKEEHDAFLNFIDGISDLGDREWYASIMLNRLMFVYFVQKQGFLDGDRDYLRSRMTMLTQSQGEGRFLSFYRHFLLRLFHEGLGQEASRREGELDELLGEIPYLNGGLFEVHELEREYPNIQVPDEAFTKIFGFFDSYSWHLDERPLREGDEINPDVLGYIFEKYINQKQMGAYYTKEDVTGYISENTIIPRLFDMAEEDCAIAFRPGSAMWKLLQDDPDRYIYEAVRKGVDVQLPPEIAAGIDDVSKRNGWNAPAGEEYALPTEIWREHVSRRERCEELRRKLEAGEISSIDELITLNLDIRQFAQDAIENSEGPELLRAFYKSLREISVLDPTCGSGAFLFAALNILEPLYEACLERMDRFVEAAETEESYADFRKILGEVNGHPNRRYFVLKSIIIGNLYGVDIMEEAVEIARLRLFLKLMAQLEDVSEIEPLPDIDFNVRAGNTLVGFASFEEVQEALGSKLDIDQAVDRIEEGAAEAGEAFSQFRAMQVGDEANSEEFRFAKEELWARLTELSEQLDQYLSVQWGAEDSGNETFEEWRERHQPFHWCVEFYGIMDEGGFDVIVGNPPYVVYSPKKVEYNLEPANYATHKTKNLYAYVFERSLSLAHRYGPVGLIVQLTSLSSKNLAPLQDLLLERRGLRAVPFPRRPESVFDGVEMPVAILLSVQLSSATTCSSSRVQRFYTEERPEAFDLISLAAHKFRRDGYRIGKFGSSYDLAVYAKLSAHTSTVELLLDKNSPHLLYYQEACRYWVKARAGVPYFRRNGIEMTPPHGRTLRFESKEACSFVACLANSSLFYWFYSAFSDCEHINDKLVRSLNVPANWDSTNWNALSDQVSASLTQNARRKTIHTNQGHTIEYDEINASQSKALIDKIDAGLAEHYGFTDEELDFIVNYDIKYRMGLGS